MPCQPPSSDGREPGPASPGQEPALAPAVAPADDLETAVAPDRQPRVTVTEEEAHLPLPAAIVGATPQAVPPDQFRGQFAPCQGNPGTHRVLGGIPLSPYFWIRSTSFPGCRRCRRRWSSPIDRMQRQRGAAAQGEAADPLVDPSLQGGDRLRPVGRRVEQAAGAGRGSKAARQSGASGRPPRHESRPVAGRAAERRAARRTGRSARPGSSGRGRTGRPGSRPRPTADRPGPRDSAAPRSAVRGFARARHTE